MTRRAFGHELLLANPLDVRRMHRTLQFASRKHSASGLLGSPGGACMPSQKLFTLSTISIGHPLRSILKLPLGTSVPSRIVYRTHEPRLPAVRRLAHQRLGGSAETHNLPRKGPSFGPPAGLQ